MKITGPQVVNVSYSELRDFRQCPLKHFLGYTHGLRSPTRVDRLEFGTAWHGVLEAHYLALQQHADKAGIYELTERAVANAVDLGLSDEDLDRLRWMYEGYVQVYGNDPGWTFEAVEHWFDFTLTKVRLNGVDYEIRIRGKIDLIKRNDKTGKRVAVDHKSVGGRDLTKGAWLSETELDDQFTLYHAAINREGLEVKYAEWNAARTDKLKRAMSMQERFSRHSYHSSQAKLDAVWADSAAAARAMLAIRLNPDRLYSAPDPRNCGWSCDFVRVHTESRASGRDPVETALSYGFTTREDRDARQVLEVESLEGGW